MIEKLFIDTDIILDIVLKRELAMQNHYPAIDILSSISRVMDDIISSSQKESANKLKAVMATYKKSEDLINIGAYVAGSNSKIDYAIEMNDRATGYLMQGMEDCVTYDESVQQLEELFK